MKTPILGSAYVTRSVNAADNRMVNLFPEIVPEGGKSAAYLQRAPGLRLLQTLPDGPVRGMWTVGDFAYVVAGTHFYEVSSTWAYREIGTLAAGGAVSMADNGTQIFIACNGPAYVYDIPLDFFTPMPSLNFPGAVTVGYIDGYFVFNAPNSQQIWVTGLLDATSISPLDFASAEGNPDNVISIIVDHREVWLFGTNSTEVWYDAGLSDFPLARIQGAFNEIGCIAPYSVAKLDNAVFWLGADARGRGIVYRTNGYIGQRVSTHSIEWQIQNYDNMADAVAYTYQQDGHAFYVLNFPSANTTWVFDVATSAWHERASWDNGIFTRHRGNCQLSYNNKIVIGDYQNGNLYAFDLMDYSDNGGVQKWLRSWRALPTGENNLNRTTQHSLQLDCQSGVGTVMTPQSPSETLMTESGDLIIVNYDIQTLTTQAGDIIITEPGGEDIITLPDVFPFNDPPVYLQTEFVPASASYNAEAMLRWSDDGGHTWSNEHWKSMGKIGEYGYRVIWRRLGMTLKLRDRVYEVSGTAPVKIAIVDAELHMSPTNG